jgi:hypothetical protein
MADRTQEAEDNRAKTAYEREDWPLGAVGIIYLGIFVFLVAIPLILVWAYPSSVSDASRRLLVEPPAPRLQIDPERDLAEFRTKKNKELNTYYWVNKQKGIVHIPIDQAMKQLAAQGIEGFPKGQP